MENEEINQEKHNVPKWLKELQENSWELELLISGGAIFSLFHFSDVLLGAVNAIKITSALPGINLILIVGMIGIKVLTLGFILHLLLRSYWLAMVCVNYIYPQGVREEKISWKKPFKVKRDERSDLYESIMNVDRICGSVIFMSISATFMLIGWIVMIFLMLTLPVLVADWFFDTYIPYSTLYDLYANFFIISFLVYIIDTLLLGTLRKIPYLTYLIFPFFWLYDLISFRFLLQKPLWVFHTNVGTRGFVLGASIFLFTALTFAYINLYRQLHWPNAMDGREYKWELAENSTSNTYYMDELDGEHVRICAIPSKVINSNFLEVFLLYRHEFDELIRINNMNSDSKYFSDITSLSIDGITYDNIEWYGKWNKDIDQLGIFAMVPIDHLPNGKHIMELKSEIKFENDQQQAAMDRKEKVVIPFWKDVN